MLAQARPMMINHFTPLTMDKKGVGWQMDIVVVTRYKNSLCCILTQVAQSCS